MSEQHAAVKRSALVVGALGVVYGDIGTSPLYAFREAFIEEAHVLTVDRINVYGVCSLAFWALVMIISLKYLFFVMKADNHGEGGILALTSLVMQRKGSVVKAGLLVSLGVFGTALLYGDGIITPAISVLSAVEGLNEVSTSFERWIIPIAVAILIGLFSVQKRGTGAVGRVFGPIMIVWFTVIALLGLRHIVHAPEVIQSINPVWAVRFFEHESMKAFLALGSIFLVVTGGEALYADMGHFGRKPITVGWYCLVLPALLLNYWGQGAFLLENPELVEQRFFFLMAPAALKLPLVILATMATIIASQALISGVFSLTQQAVQLDYLPRIRIDHTSHHHSGQIYVPLVNWALMVACVGLVIGFQTSSNLAAAYGIAVTMTMAITTLVFFRVLTDRWHWARWKAFAVCVPMLVVELGFLGANIPKIPHGGWFALGIGALLMVQMSTWRRGRQLVAARIKRGERPINEVLDGHTDIKKVNGTGVFLFKDLGMAPPALINNLHHNKVLHKTTLIVSVETADEPRIDPAERAEVTKVEPGVFQVLITYGFMEDPDVPAALAALDVRGLTFDPHDVTYFIGRESVVAGKAPGMNPALEHLFVWLNRGADSAVRFFNLPDEQVFEVGSRVEI
ncbi:MAG: potassium transporter Kup [Acidimicrobiaceae bacterium]|nr:potassium transporter Kup [Acidimicrobiaceae bacterium]MBP7890415.1 potassium transporter Kup [Ilumatobacteraceae bacterium]HAN37065.1 potassium transporter Kup [Acidimicrobiaceae bacterium]HQY16250.1 potassium transporter Kup [Ilumatobacteraceae bacterium]HQY86681.1 potassium transporter Kup [Ilumatobacteraceae bacterium]